MDCMALHFRLHNGLFGKPLCYIKAPLPRILLRLHNLVRRLFLLSLSLRLLSLSLRLLSLSLSLILRILIMSLGQGIALAKLLLSFTLLGRSSTITTGKSFIIQTWFAPDKDYLLSEDIVVDVNEIIEGAVDPSRDAKGRMSPE